MKKHRVLFLINPISGIGKQRTVEKAVGDEIDHEKIEFDIAYTEYAGHARELARNAVGKYDVVVAVGGDGTVNEVGSSLINTTTALAIIPTGSGNGLARYLDIPLRVNRALQVINHLVKKDIDTLRVNEQVSLNVAGIGFDGHISHQFAKEKNRGPAGYVKLITKEYAKYKSSVYRISIDNKTYELPAFMLTFANSSQWGNNIHIAPQAKIDDGLIDVCIIKEFPIYDGPSLLISILDQSVDQRRYDVVTRAKHITIESDEKLVGHLDGEPVELGHRAEIRIHPLSLRVIIPPKDFRKNLLDPLMELKEFLPPIPQLPNLPKGFRQIKK
ncbi:diacylglycerol kinase family lipid kinase [Carboxylicivirga sediminis]|uniref:Diacylglycerol kinase family lipid kinase n=1 Tax=Carboxylicivirga sediminis TaxID=2006564 RepID=A0A941F3P3_9BACT|nr:diacylglycerol kinase family protein [Carboxylicivirga sediminis]MBR8536186.1 diacylglycerol kinase family lipid kinase [Carboxylicivirga sediminis]